MLNAAHSDPALASAIRGADLVVPDGAGLLVAARLTGQPLRGRVPGIDLLRALCGESVKRGWRVLLMGAKPGVALAAAERLRRDHPGLAVSAVRDGYFRRDEEPAVIHDIKVATPDLLFVALGMDRQERWIAHNLSALGARVVMGVGGALDVIAGHLPRAPGWLQSLGGEWLWRLAQEPSRWRRMLGLPAFLCRVLLRSASWRAVLAGFVVVVGAGLLAGPRIARAATAELEGKTTEAFIQSGGILVEFDERTHPRTLRATCLVWTSPEKLWSVVTDYGHWSDFIPGFTLSRVLQRSATETVVEQDATVQVLVLKITSHAVVRMKEIPATRIEFEQVKGDFKSYDGRWLIAPTEDPDIARLTYEMRAVTHSIIPTPDFLVRPILRRELENRLQGIRTRAEQTP